jgi:hypothetical protein
MSEHLAGGSVVAGGDIASAVSGGYIAEQTGTESRLELKQLVQLKQLDQTAGCGPF